MLHNGVPDGLVVVDFAVDFADLPAADSLITLRAKEPRLHRDMGSFEFI